MRRISIAALVSLAVLVSVFAFTNYSTAQPNIVDTSAKLRLDSRPPPSDHVLPTRRPNRTAAVVEHAQMMAMPATVQEVQTPPTGCWAANSPPVPLFECECGPINQACVDQCMAVWRALQNAACEEYTGCVKAALDHYKTERAAAMAAARACIQAANGNGPLIDQCLSNYNNQIDALNTVLQGAYANCQSNYDLWIDLADDYFQNCVVSCCPPCPPDGVAKEPR